MTRPQYDREPVLRRRVLVADDDATMRDILFSLLTGAGYSVILAATGGEAITLASDLDMSIAFVDLDMPGGNGLQTCASLREMPRWNRVPIIILTQYSIERAFDTSLQAGASGFLCKPLVPSELWWCLENHLGGGRAVMRSGSSVIGDFVSVFPLGKAEEDTQRALDRVVLPGAQLLPVGSEGILRHRPHTLLDQQQRGVANISAGPVKTRIRVAAQSVFGDTLDIRRIAKDFAPGVMAGFLRRLASSVEDIVLGLDDGILMSKPRELASRLHNLAGTAGTLGCVALSAAARDLEYDSSSSDQILLNFTDIAKATLEAIDGYVIHERGTAPESSPARSLNVLVVDDVSMIREFATAFLHAAGHNVTCVEDGVEAIAAVANFDFQVVLMDVRMPGMDGLDATRRIRGLDGPRGQVPVVALTALASPEQIAECQNAGMDSHLAKPFDADTLRAAVLRATLTHSRL